MSVLVTGAAGFIGRRLVARLLADGARVRALLLPGEDAGAVPGAEVVRGDVTDPASLVEAVAGVDRIHHLAAVVGDWGPDELYRSVNVEGTRNVLDAAAAAGCRRVVMVSSIVVYGSQLRTAVCDEVAAPREYGIGAYSRTKRVSEELALDYHAFGRVPVTVVRPGNVYGPESGVWVDGVLEILRAGDGMLIDGGEGDAVLAYVDNVVEVIVLAGASEDAGGRVYNANDGGGVTWRQYFADLAGLAGVAPPRRVLGRRPAMAAAAAMEGAWLALGRRERPLLTREAVTLLSSRHPVPIARAAAELGYRPPVAYREALDRLTDYIHGGAR
jgi:2-alkyl-3-oxoalkanoate reductase